jgi:hypothetical protein
MCSPSVQPAQNHKIPRMGVDFPAPNVFIERRLGAGPAEGPSSFGIGAGPGTRSTAGQAPGCPPRPADDRRRCADRLMPRAGRPARVGRLKRNSAFEEIGTKHNPGSMPFIRSGPTMKTFIWLSFAFVLAASVAVFSVTSSPSSVRAETTVNHLY